MHYVLACDPEHGGDALLRVARRLAGDRDRLTVVHVVNPLGEPWLDRERDLAEAVAHVVARRRQAIRALLADQAIEAAVTVAPAESGEHTAPAVARIAAAVGADVLMVMSKRASGLRGMLFGSVAQGLLALSPCPVLVVRPGDDGTSSALVSDQGG